jgi:hypothetical protein
MNNNYKSKYCRSYVVDRSGESEVLHDVTAWDIVVSGNVSGKSPEQIQRIIDDYEEKEIGRLFLEKIREYEGHFNDKDGVPTIEDVSFICTYRNLQDFVSSDKNEQGYKVASWAKEDDVYILNYDFNGRYFGAYRIKSPEDVVFYLRKQIDKLEKCDDPLVKEDEE